MADHFPRAALEKFVDGELPAEEFRRIERHLDNCINCQRLHDKLVALARLELLESWLYPVYDETFERAAARAAARLEDLRSESRSTEALSVQLLRDDARTRRSRIRSEERFHSLKLCELLQRRSRDNWFCDPATALELADLAVGVAHHLDTRVYGSSLVEDSRAISLAYLGNAFRLTADLWRADQALREAWVHHIKAGEDISTEAELLDLTCSLRDSQGRRDEAVQLSDRVITIFRDVRDSHAEGTGLIHKALILGRSGRLQDAILLVREGLARIDAHRQPRARLIGIGNLITFLSWSGSPETAHILLTQNRYLFDDLGDRMDRARIQWLEGDIAGQLGQVSRAKALLQNVLDFFLEHSLGIEAFSVSMSLAEIYAQIGRHEDLTKLLHEVIPLGEALGLHREVFQARLWYEQISRP